MDYNPLNKNLSQDNHSILPKIDYASLKVIYVDDESMNREIVNEYLGVMGIEHINSFENPLDAIKFIKSCEGSIDLLITDHSMPECTGDIVARIFKERFSNSPVMVHSSSGKWIKSAYSGDIYPVFALKPSGFEQFKNYIDQTLNS